jgi:LPXTG-site transpeptidase (sortase) family protein
MMDETAQIPAAPTPDRSARRRTWMRRTGNLMIAASVLTLLGIVFYFVGTCVYTARQQDQLRDELAAENPDLAAAEATVSEKDFVSVVAWAESVLDAAAAVAAEAKRTAELAGLKAAADAFALETSGEAGRPIGRIVIPSIGVDVVMVEGELEGLSESYLKEGPGHWPETPFPGQGGSFVVSGHRTTWGAPFFKLNELQPGDEIKLVLPYAIVRYEVTQVIVVLPEDIEAVAYRGKEQVSLVACHPLHSAKERIIAQGDMSSFVLLESGD